MLRRTRPSSQSYQVAAVCGSPVGLTVATTAGFGRARKASTSGGTGTRGMRAEPTEPVRAPRRSSSSSPTSRTARRRMTNSVLATIQPAAIRR